MFYKTRLTSTQPRFGKIQVNERARQKPESYRSVRRQYSGSRAPVNMDRRYVIPKLIRNGVDKEQLIQLVHKRPAIWDKHCDIYKDKQKKIQAWKEICGIINERFNQLNERSGHEYMRAVIRIWTHTRDSYMRSQAGKKKGSTSRPYIYHRQLSFLKSILPKDLIDNTQEQRTSTEEKTTDQEGEIEVEVKQERDDTVEIDCDSGSGEDEEECYLPTYSTNDEESQDVVKKRRIGDGDEFIGIRDEFVDVGERSRIDVIDERIANYMNSRVVSNGAHLEDRHMSFFRSIQPSLSVLNDDQILEFQSGVITLLQNIKRGRKFD